MKNKIDRNKDQEEIEKYLSSGGRISKFSQDESYWDLKEELDKVFSSKPIKISVKNNANLQNKISKP